MFLRQFKYLVEVAEQEHFGSAAQGVVNLTTYRRKEAVVAAFKRCPLLMLWTAPPPTSRCAELRWLFMNRE